MSHLKYSTGPTYDAQLSDQFHYSQAVRVPGNPNLIKISGQGGWHPESGTIEPPTSAEALSRQVEQAFANVDAVLKDAGSKRGWGDVYLARVYLVDLKDEGLMSGLVQALKKWCPEHRPVLTAVEVKGLALEGMRIEVEVEAWDEEGGK
jgi:enamine deaminase RidA (YjgF/YER057c/UK114 family)